MSKLVSSRPRPTLGDTFVTYVHDEVLHWISGQEERLGSFTYKEFLETLPKEPEEFRRLLLSAFYSENGDIDAFRIATDLKTVLNWPVNAEFVALLDRAIRYSQKHGHRLAQIEWVLATGIRFNREAGEDVEYSGENFRGFRVGRVNSVDKAIAKGVVTDKFGSKVYVLGENIKC